jgi:para-aminobenzoate synthetase/4-amino-4-deoxychorismate lyase
MRDPGGARVIVQPVRQALDYGERPDPATGIFETLLVQDGRLPMRDQHYARINASAAQLYGAREVITVPAQPLPPLPASGRMRITFAPGEGLARASADRLSPDPVYTELAPFVLAGGLGPHKWLDRTLLDALTAAAGPRALALLLDEDHAVLEGSWASVLIEERGRLISPPDDGRALPGIGRTRLQYDEEPVDLDRLLAADAVVLTSALRVVRLPLAV